MHNIDENEVLRDALSGLNEDVPAMPEGLHAAWMQKVEDTKMEKTRTMKTVTRWLSVAAAMVFVIGGTMLTKDGLDSATLRSTQAYQSANLENGSLKSSMNLMLGAAPSAAYDYSEAVEEEYAMDTGAGVMLTSNSMARGSSTMAAKESAPAPAEKKIIRTASMTIATQTFEDSLNALKSACEGQGGWIESSSESTNSYSGLRTAYLTLRIPQDGLDAYLAGTEGLGRVTSKSESAQDVTASYQDTQNRLNTQLALMERLQALITESGDLSDLLALESQIADTQYMIDSLQSSLNSTDRQVSYSTVNVTLKEEKTVELTDTTVSFGERILSAVAVGWEAFTGFLGDMVVFLVAALPFMVIVAVVVIVIKLIRRRRK
ncbi:MAG: DUF4349 domain-containing protein [Clostridia bacterium]|nr:DUF4349 domain-containing protein [Clostridia bacterium]